MLREETLPHGLNVCRELFESFDAITEAAARSAVVSDEAKSCGFMNNSWILEILVGLAENEFERVSPFLKSKIFGHARCPKSTKLIENVFNYVRTTTSTRAKHLSAERVHYLSHASGEDKSNERPIPQVSSEAKTFRAASASSS